MRAAWIAFAIGSAFYLFEFVARVEPGLAARQISDHFGLSHTGFGTLSSLFFWVYAPMQILVGLLLDRFGARRLILLGSAVCTCGVALFAATGSVWIAGAGRLLTGLGAAFAFVSALWLVNHWFAPERFAVLSGSVNAAGMMGTAIGTVVLSNMIAVDGWRNVFLATGLAGLALFVLALLYLKEPASPARTAPDGIPPDPWHNLATVATNGRIWALSIVGMLYYMPVNVYGGLWGASELIGDHQRTPLVAETTISMIFWGMALGSIAGGWISDRIGHRKYLIVIGATLTAVAYSAVIYLPIPDPTERVLLLFAGFLGGFQMLTFAMAKEGVANQMAGTTIGFVNMIGIAGATIFQPLVGDLVDAFDGNFGLALATVPACAAMAALLMMFISEVRHPDHRPNARKFAY